MVRRIAIEKDNRFVNDHVLELHMINRTPISGYEDAPVMPLEEAVERVAQFYYGVVNDADRAKDKCRKNTALTLNESAAIYLYTMTTPFYSALNRALRSENPQAIYPWFPFLKLLITG
ncbi:unnamed protein product, partial [Rotaria sp. Silwood2]